MSKVKESNKFVEYATKFLKWLTPVLQVIIAILAVLILLGLAVKGSMMYLANIDDTQRTIAAVIVVALLAYAIGTGLRRIIK